MATYAMTCSCGDTMSADAADRESAVKQIQGMMTQDALNQHFAQKHPTEAVPPLAQVHAMVSQAVAAV